MRTAPFGNLLQSFASTSLLEGKVASPDAQVPHDRRHRSGSGESETARGGKPWHERSLVQRLVVFAVALAAAAALGYWFTFPPRGFFALWPPSGLILGFFLIERRRNWLSFITAGLPGFVAVACLVYDYSAIGGVLLYLANIAQAWMGALLVSRFASESPPALTRVRDIVGLSAAAVLAPSISASIALLASPQGLASAIGRWPLTWAADSLGIVIVTPLLLTLAVHRQSHSPRRLLEIIELCASFLGLILTAQAIFGTGSEGRDIVLTFPFFTIPFLFWISVRFGLRSTALSCAVLAGIAIVNTAHGAGPFPFVGEAQSGHAFMLQTFVAVSSLSTLLLATTMEDRKRSEAQIRSLNMTLEQRVLDRTSELEASERRFQTLAEAAPVGIFSTDESGFCVYVNDQWCGLTGWSVGEALGQSWLDAVYPEDRERVARRWEVAQHDKESFSVEFRLLHCSGKVSWVVAQAAPIRETEETYTGFIGIVTDITERKNAESSLQRAHDELESRVRARTKELSQTNLELKKNEHRVRSIIDSATDAFIAVDANGFITDWNPQAAGVFGYAREDVLGKGLASVIFAIEGEDAHRNALQFLFATGSGPLLRNLVEFQARRADSSLFPAEMAISPAGEGDNRFFSVFLREITERKNAEAAIRESESILRSFFDSTPLMMGLVELVHDDILHLSDNPASARFFGREPQEMAGRRAAELGVPPRQLRLWMSHYRESEQNGQPMHFNYTADTAEGPRDLSVTVCFATRGPGGRSRFAYVAEDITRRKQADEDLREKTAALENAAEGIARFDSRGCFLSVNKAYADVTGYEPEELLGQEWLMTAHPQDRSRMKVAYQTMLAQGKAEDEILCVRKDGTAFFQQQVIVSTYDRDGNFIGHYAFVRDITSRKRAEIERDRFFTMSLDMLCIAGTNGYFRRLNPAFERTLGYSIAELQAAPFIHFVHPDDRERTTEAFESMANGQECIDLESRFRCKDGSFRWLSWTATPYAAEEIIYAVARDVTERKRAEERILASLEEKDVLLKEIHHRVKNNLQVVSSLLQLQSGYIKDKATLETFRESQNRIRSMAMIHEKLYQNETLARIDFEEYATGLSAMLIRSYATNPGVKLQTAIEKAWLNLDTAVPIGLITNELLSNALKYAFPNGHPGVIRIALESREEPGAYCLTVSDTGIGMPGGVKMENASSLGLRLVKILTNQIGGELTCDTGENGTIFSMSFNDAK